MRKNGIRSLTAFAMLLTLLFSLVPSALADTGTQAVESVSGTIEFACTYQEVTLYASGSQTARDEDSITQTVFSKHTNVILNLGTNNLQEIFEILANGGVVQRQEWQYWSFMPDDQRWVASNCVIDMDAPITITFSSTPQSNYANVVNTFNKKVVITGNNEEAGISALDNDEETITVYNGSAEGITIISRASRFWHSTGTTENPPEENQINFTKGLEIRDGAVLNIKTDKPVAETSNSSAHRCIITIGEKNGTGAELTVDGGTLNLSGLKFAFNDGYPTQNNWPSSTYLKFSNASMTVSNDGTVALDGVQVEGQAPTGKNLVTVKETGTLTVEDGKPYGNGAPSNITVTGDDPAVKCEAGSSLTITGNSAVKSGGTKAVELVPGAKVTTDVVKDLTVAENMAEAYVDNAGNVIQKADENDLPAFMEPTEAQGNVASGVGDTDNKLKEAAGNVGAELPTDAQTAAAHEWAHERVEEAKEALDSADEDVNIYVLTTVKTEVEDFKANTAMTLDITPYYEVIATTAETKDEIQLEEGQEKNAVLLSEKELVVNEPVQMTIPIPDTLYKTEAGEQTPSFVVLHEHEGKVYLYHATYSSFGDVGAHITFTNEHGFSKFTVIVVRQGSLSNLTSSVGSMETFDPSKEEKSYTVNVPYSVSDLTLTATAAVQDDTVTAKLGDSNLTPVKDGTVTDKDVYTINVTDLEVGKNTVTITVTHSGGAPTTYTVTINRAAYVPPVPPSYTVTVEADEHAAVEASASSARAGTEITVTVTPAEGYHVSGLTVTAANGSAVAVTDNGDGTYTFTMPASAVTVKAETFPCSATVFPDLDADEWYHEYTDYVVSEGIMNGDEGSFKPHDVLTRAELATVLWNLSGQKDAGEDVLTFSDVAEGDWFYAAVQWASGEGIVNGYEDGSFKPDQAVTREELAVMLYRYAESIGEEADPEYTIPATYTDVADIGDWALEAMSWCVQNGIINGRTATTIEPGATAERCEVAAMLTRYLRPAE